MINVFDEIKKNFGFGMMRLPKIGDEIDYEQVNKMVDYFIENGFNYFDTAHGYHSGKSEVAIGKCLTSRHSRDEYILTDKLTDIYFDSEADIRPLFEEQLKTCGVEYFDFYLMHSQNATNFKKFKECNAYETAFKLKEEGKIRHVGISFHDRAEVLERILTEYPQIEIVQIQLNYVDWEDHSVESKKCYEVCVKHNKPVIVMEPVKCGNLIQLPEDADKILRDLNGGSNASYAIRFAASHENVRMVLSGMSNLEQLMENVETMRDFKPLSEVELEAIQKVCNIFNSKGMIPCTACHYCTDGCPMSINIPELFACMNKYKVFNEWNQRMYFRSLTSDGHSKPSECIECGQCEGICPQSLPIIDLLKDVSKTFETSPVGDDD